MFRVRQWLSAPSLFDRRGFQRQGFSRRGVAAGLVSGAVLLTGSVTRAQGGEEECATALTPADAMRVLELRRAGAYDLALPPGAFSRGLCGLPMTIHVVRRGNGTGGLEQAWVDACIADANAHFASSGVSFHQEGPTLFIDSDVLYDINIADETNILRLLQVVPGTINIYFVNSATYCGISSFTFNPVQGIVINNNCTPREGNRSTFSHEVGHYFDLFHTHETVWGVECPGGLNCAIAGDLVCDTPADPRLTGLVDAACGYTGAVPSPCLGGPAYAPDTRNLMSYSRHECRRAFSEGQSSRLLATLLNLRPELVCDGPPCPADWDGSGGVDSVDIVAYLGAWLASAQGGTLDADVNGDLVVNAGDISAFLTSWLAAVGGGC